MRPAARAGSTGSAHAAQVPPGCSRYEVELSRPLGLFLEETKSGTIVVAEIPEGGKAARLNTISVGDTLISTSALVYTRESEYQGNMVKSGEKRVILNCRGEVRSAMRAHGRVFCGVHVAFQAVPDRKEVRNTTVSS